MATIIDRRMFAKGFAATAVATGAVALAGCSGEETPAGSGAASGTSYKIGVLQLTEHSALDAANAGFVKALDDSGITYEIEQQNAQKRKDPHTLEEIPDDTDDLEDEAEIQAWKEREFRRIMRAREKEEQRKQVEACGESEG